MNVDKTIKKLYDRIDIVGESKQMHNRLYVSRVNRLIKKLKTHKFCKCEKPYHNYPEMRWCDRCELEIENELK